MGSVILAKLFKDLSELHNLKSAARIYVSGSSAGATGVLMNIDKISQRLINLAPKAQVRGIIDSGWYLDNMPFKKEADCRDNPLHCSPSKAISIGYKYWKGVVPSNCAKQFGSEVAWKCYFGHRVYPTLKSNNHSSKYFVQTVCLLNSFIKRIFLFIFLSLYFFKQSILSSFL